MHFCLAGVAADDDESPGLPGGVFEDRGDESGVAVRVPDSHVVRETLSAILRVQDQSSPLWQAYAAYEMANGGIKVISFSIVDPTDASKETKGLHIC